MATVNEQIVTGRAHRVLIDKVAKLWQKISFWTKSSDVEFNDGKSAETKVGAIDGITDSLASTSSRIAASAKALNTVNNKLSGVSFDPQAEGLYAEYKVGADTVRKKLGSGDFSLTFTLSSSTSGSWKHDQYRYGNWSGSNSTTVTITCTDGEVTVENGALSYGVSANNGSGRGNASIYNIQCIN